MDNRHLIEDLKALITTSKQEVALSVNYSMSLLYWNIGKRISEEILNEKRATYGKQIIARVSNQLSTEYGSSFSEKTFAECCNSHQHFLKKKLSYH